MEEFIKKGGQMVQDARAILVFTGAGLSTESDIPDFRSPGGIWDRYDPADFYFQKIVSDDLAREKYWEMSREFYAGMRDARPNRGHLALKELEETGKLLAIVTQNIDFLHQKAGNRPEKIIEIHGTAFTVSCLRCGKKYGRDEIEQRLERGVRDPRCDDCSGILKPDTISFGQAMPEDKMAEAFEHAQACDMCLVLGSSLVVYPAASVPVHAADCGAKLMIINREPTPLDSRADLVIHAGLGETLGRIMEGIR